MFSILHITDLHRIESEPLTNAELISALVADRDSYIKEDPPISRPQAIVVSGDIVQGVRLGEPDFAKRLAEQYSTASTFLGELADRFLDGDRSRVVIIPGNHDVDWNTAKASMVAVASGDVPGDLPRAIYEPGSRYRWDWKNRQLFFVQDEHMYGKRLAAFWIFFEDFYRDVGGLLKVAPWSDANLYSLDNGRIGVAAFNSCVGNDCFASHGEIPREVIARAHLDLDALGDWNLRIAVWHHDIEGPPYRADYMDPDIVRGMIGRGFRLGLYGHQHKTQITPQHAFLPDLETMAITSAGSLCAGSHELPVGARRGYSLIEINDDYSGARIHVREMAFANLFSRANLPIFGGRSYVDLAWTKPVDAAGRPEDPGREARFAALSAAEKVLRQDRDPKRAVALLKASDAISDGFGRQLLIEAAQEASDFSTIISTVLPPISVEELVVGVDAYLALRRVKNAQSLLSDHKDRLDAPSAIASELQRRIDLAGKVKS